MADDAKDRDAMRQERLRAALRDNLKRRKSQAKGRATMPSHPGAQNDSRGRSDQDNPADGIDDGEPPIATS